MKTVKQLSVLFLKHKEVTLSGRYINNEHVLPLLDNLPSEAHLDIIAHSVNGRPIHAVTIGKGPIKILVWSQMHGNESTTTKALFDIINTLKADALTEISNAIQLCIIPILNPDGAQAYQRLNANDIDLNRDAQNRSQPESLALRALYDKFKPDYCFNLHGQRTIYSAGKTNKSATLSFLAPAEDEAATVTETRKKAMSVIAAVNSRIQTIIPGQVAIYDDTYNINCVGDTFQSLGSPSILFEAGHYKNDYDREKVREFMFISIITALSHIVHNHGETTGYKSYFDIPKNEELYFDIIIRNARKGYTDESCEIAIQYQEELIGATVYFLPEVKKIKPRLPYFAHREIDAVGQKVLGLDRKSVFEGYENDIVFINNALFSLKLVKT